jgi:hypothetical protein
MVGFRALELAAVGGVVASPIIGLAVGAIVQRRFERAAWGGQVVLALASLYLGATLFAVVLGSVDALVSDASSPLGVVWDNTTGVWYGTTLLLTLLFPLMYVTHLRLASPNAWWRKR